jgi:hypothetical protein
LIFNAIKRGIRDMPSLVDTYANLKHFEVANKPLGKEEIKGEREGERGRERALKRTH